MFSTKIDKTTINGVVVSTAITIDCGPETAIIDSNAVYPVERYSSEEDAILGHKKWVEKMKDGSIEEVVCLGWLGLIEDVKVTLHRSNWKMN